MQALLPSGIDGPHLGSPAVKLWKMRTLRIGGYVTRVEDARSPAGHVKQVAAWPWLRPLLMRHRRFVDWLGRGPRGGLDHGVPLWVERDGRRGNRHAQPREGHRDPGRPLAHGQANPKTAVPINKGRPKAMRQLA